MPPESPAQASPSLRQRRPVAVTRPPKRPPPSTVPPGEGGTASKYFGLQPPKAGQKPPTQKRRLGLSTAPLKVVAKPQFSTRAIGQTPGQAEAEAAAAKEANANRAPDSRFVAWLKAGHGLRPDTQVARNYLLCGPPFLGTHDYERKEAVRDAGAVWWKNPEKQEGCTDRRVRFGWYSAPNERILEALLELEPREKADRSGLGSAPCYAWSPRDCAAPATGEAIRTLLAEHAVDATARDKSERATAQVAQEKREELQRERDRMAGRAADGDAEITRLKEAYGVVWRPTLAKAARIAPLLGPTVGISEVERVLRGLDLGIVAPEDVRKHKFIDRIRSSKRRAGPSSSSLAAAADDGTPAKDYNHEPPDAPVLLFGKKHPWMIKMPTDSEFQRERAAQIVPEPPGARSVRPLETYCLNCYAVVWDQFPRCSHECEEGRDRASVWHACLACGAMRCDPIPGIPNTETLQECLCDDEDGEGWRANQREASERAPRDEGLDDVDDDDPGGGLVQGAFPIAGDELDDFANDAPVGVVGVMDAWLDGDE